MSHLPKHTWVFEADSRLLRFYRTVWGADPAKANFCKLFWSVVCAPIGVLAWPVRRVFRRELNFPEKVGRAFEEHPRVEAAIAAATILWPAGWAIYLLVRYAMLLADAFWQTLQRTVFGIGCVAILGGVIAGVVYLDRRRGTLRRVGRFLADGYRSVKSHTCPRIVLKDAA